ncbi:MAG: hypothetical protein JWQ74_2378 [Marmoricola sp.]|nr:hypothetical protein [Marmoricola sp.]
MSTLEIIGVDATEPRAHLVLVHGAWHGAWCWQDGFAQRLADHGISTVAPSLRGHAGSAAGVRLNAARMRDYVDDVASVVAGLRSSSGAAPFVAGHSMGGGVVQGLLARSNRPPMAGAALLASVPPRGVIGVTTQIALHSPGTFLASNATLDLGRLVRTPEQVRSLFFTPRTSVAIVEAATERVQSESYLAFLDMLVLDRPKPGPIGLPVLVLGASDDAIFTAADTTATATAWGAEQVTVDGIGHDVMLDDGWERVADELAAWVLGNLS